MSHYTSRTMHIGIDTRLTYYRTGGISTYMRRLVSALETIDSHNAYTIFQSRKASYLLTKRFKTAKLWTPCHHQFERIALSVELSRFAKPAFVVSQKSVPTLIHSLSGLASTS